MWDIIPRMTSSPSPVPTSRSTLVLATVVAVIKPLVRLLLRHGVAYPAFVAALKPVFLAAARTECLADALDNRIEFGVWGGMTERERRALLRRRPEVTSWSNLLASAREQSAAPVAVSQVVPVVRAGRVSA